MTQLWGGSALAAAFRATSQSQVRLITLRRKIAAAGAPPPQHAAQTWVITNPIRPRKKRRHTRPMPWMRRFAKIWSRSQSHLAIAREWLSLAWALIGGPKGFAPLLNNTAVQKQMRWMLRLSEAVLRLAITERAKAIAVPPLTSVRRGMGDGALPPLDRPIAPYVARFRLDAPDDRWAISPPNTATLIRKPRQPIALLFRLMACQDGLDRFEILAHKEARRWRQNGARQQVLRHAPGGGEAVDQWHPASTGIRELASAQWDYTIPIHHAEGNDEAYENWHPPPAWILPPLRKME